MAYVYIFADKGPPSCCKIGTSKTLESRFKEARCHSVRGINPWAFYDVGPRRVR